ncbi:hypothetical protein [Ferrimonas pelagia]|uniref:Uncharacterized protein n=1 Tax=Ferrimonas pelagia TaxID=1177826 RepID=A0ABP9ED96_9GAMM
MDSPKHLQKFKRKQSKASALQDTEQGAHSADGAHPSRRKSLRAVLLVAAIGVSVALLWPAGGSSDGYSESEVIQMNQQFELALANGSSLLIPVDITDNAQLKEAKAVLDSSGLDSANLIQQAEGGYIALAWVTVWDNLEEDGDVIEVSASGVSYTVPIRHAPTKIVVPYSIDTPSLSLKGIRDGGGGITVSAKTQQGEISIPPLTVGQTMDLRF